MKYFAASLTSSTTNFSQSDLRTNSIKMFRSVIMTVAKRSKSNVIQRRFPIPRKFSTLQFPSGENRAWKINIKTTIRVIGSCLPKFSTWGAKFFAIKRTLLLKFWQKSKKTVFFFDKQGEQRPRFACLRFGGVFYLKWDCKFGKQIPYFQRE